MNEDEKERDYIKEEQKGLFEFVRMYTLLIIALSASASSLFLRDNFNINDRIILYFVLNLLVLITIILLLFKAVLKIDFNYIKLKNL